MLDKIDNQKTMIFFGAHPDDETLLTCVPQK